MNDEQQLTFQLGITSVPSDATCDDNGLAECIGMVYDDGEHRVIQKPVVSFQVTSGHTLLYIHKIATTENKITINSSNALYCNGNTITTSGYTASTANVKIESVGKTLIVKDVDKINYFLWNPNNSTYVDLGDSLPEVELKFWMEKSSFNVESRKDHGDCMYFQSGNPYPKDQGAYNELVVGMYEKNKRSAFRYSGFVNPFFIRYALELFDGSYTHVSPPVLMFPSVHHNSYAYYMNGEALKYVRISTGFSYLRYKWITTQDLTPWKDIIKNVVVFASDEIDVYDLAEDQIPQSNTYNDQALDWRDGIYRATQGARSMYNSDNVYPTQSGGEYFLPLKKRDIKNDLENTSIFYKICSVGVTPSNDSVLSASKRIEKYTLENITEQERLPDDYYSHCPLAGDSIYTYNNRLLLSQVKRGFYKGAAHFSGYDSSGSHNWAIEVTIKTASGDKTVIRNVSTEEYLGKYYFFYPDPRATQAKIYCGSTVDATLTLKEHPGLNGAYWVGSLPTDNPAPSGSGSAPSTTDPSKELFPNQVWVSEVNNPFVFKAEGNITVGNGSIIGLSSLTQALSQGQFGQYPLIIFTTEGIRAASTGGTGLFVAVHPMSREVALLDNPCITQTDGAVFFASKKGLMVVVGNEVKCVSEQLGGAVAVLDNQSESFAKFLSGAVVAYDYRDSLLWIMKKDGTQAWKDNKAQAWIYSIKSGAFAHYEFVKGENDPAVNINVVNNYPDSLIQIGTNVYSLTGRPDINEDGTTTVVNNENVFTPNTYSASLVTRAMKFGNGIALKNIMRMKQVMQLHGENGALSVRILAKNELSDVWHELSHLRGTPWKYYQLRYTFTDLLATDRFGGTMLITQTRRTNKLR